MKLDRLIARAPTLRLAGERVVLRAQTEVDVETAIAHESDRSIMRWIRDPMPPDELERRVRGAMRRWTGADGEWLLLVVADRGDDCMLGIVCCRVTVAEHETMEIGYRLHPDVHGRGLATEACTLLFDFLFDEIEVRKLLAFCVADNAPSWRLMERLGMRREGLLRAHSFLDGAWRDEVVCGLLQDEWRAT